MTDWIIGSCVLIVAVFAIRKVFGTRISSTLGSCDGSFDLSGGILE